MVTDVSQCSQLLCVLTPRGVSGPHLLSVNAFRHGPRGHDVVHHPLAQTFGDLVKFQEVPDIVEHLVVTVGVGVHLLEDGGHVSKDGGVEQSCRRHSVTFSSTKVVAFEKTLKAALFFL